MLEVQALCAERDEPEGGGREGGGGGQMMAPAVRTAVGFSPARLQLLLAVLAKFVLGRGLHSFPFPLNLSLPCPFPLNVSSLCPP